MFNYYTILHDRYEHDYHKNMPYNIHIYQHITYHNMVLSFILWKLTLLRLQVNASPSLTANTVADYEMKYGLLDDLLTSRD